MVEPVGREAKHPDAGRLRALRPDDLGAAARAVYNENRSGPRSAGPTHFVVRRDDGSLAGPFNMMLHAPRVGGPLAALAAVPTTNLVALTGGEKVDAGGRTFEVAYTPGHASHHVSFFDGSSGVAFVGDTAGVRINGGYVLPPTPPPDIDVELWTASVDRILGWSPATLMLTHFGPVTEVRPHFAALLSNLRTTASIALSLLNETRTDEERARSFAERLRALLQSEMPESQLRTYYVAAAYEYLFNGLARYWRKKGAAA